MTAFQEELLDAIEEMALDKGMAVKDVIQQAVELANRQKSHTEVMAEEMFKGW